MGSMTTRAACTVTGLALIVAFAACAAPPDGDPEVGVSEAKFVVCPEGQFGGYDCSVPGQLCASKCYGDDARPGVFVRVAIDGRTVDSRDVPYAPVWDLDRVQVYGCDIWDFQGSARRQGLSVQFKKLYKGAFLAGAPSDFEDEVEIYAPNFAGPGTYTSDARYRPSDEASTSGRTYAQRGACTMSVLPTGDGGLKGTFACPAVAPSAAGAASVVLTGEFACGGATLDAPIFSRIPPR